MQLHQPRLSAELTSSERDTPPSRRLYLVEHLLTPPLPGVSLIPTEVRPPLRLPNALSLTGLRGRMR